MRIVRVLPLLLLTAACFRGSAENPKPGDAALLTGTWTLTAHRAGDSDIVATVTLLPSAPDDKSVPASLRGGTLEGGFVITAHGWLPSPPNDTGVSALIESDSAVIVYLRLQGRCTDCGNLGFSGKYLDGKVTGHWSQELTTHPAQGDFVMVKR